MYLVVRCTTVLGRFGAQCSPSRSKFCLGECLACLATASVLCVDPGLRDDVPQTCMCVTGLVTCAEIIHGASVQLKCMRSREPRLWRFLCVRDAVRQTHLYCDHPHASSVLGNTMWDITNFARVIRYCVNIRVGNMENLQQNTGRRLQVNLNRASRSRPHVLGHYPRKDISQPLVTRRCVLV